MAIKYTTADAEAKIQGVKIAVYSRSGGGKTVLCATAPAPLIISRESGLLSLSAKNLRRIHEWITDDIPVAVIETLDDLVTIQNKLEANDPDFASFETICLDSATEIAEQVLTSELKRASDPRQAYGELLVKMTEVFKSFRDLPGRNVVFVAKETTNKDGCIPLHIPAMPGSRLGLAMPYLFDIVLHLDVGKTPEGQTYRFLQTAPDVNYDAKDRSGCLDAVEEPNLTKLIQKIKANE